MTWMPFARPTLRQRMAVSRMAPSDGIVWPVPIALCITGLDVGGAERAMVSLATGLDRSRWAPIVVALGPEGPLAAPLRAAGIRVDCLDVNPRRPIAAARDLARVFRGHGARLVQGFLHHANVAARVAGPMAGRPRPIVLGGIRVAERRDNWHLRAERATGHLGAGWVCVSEGVRRFSVEAGRLRGDDLVVIPNGVDPAPFDRAEAVDRSTLGVPNSAFLALYVGRIDGQKGVDVLLDAAEAVARVRDDWHLAIVGDGPMRGELESNCSSRPDLAGRVHWLGRRSDVPGLLKAADHLVLPSLWEGMPNVVLEAMAARRGVVGTRVEGTEDLVVPEQTGWLVAPGQPEPLAEALLEAAGDRDRLRRFGEAGRSRVDREFTPARVVEAYDDLWSRLLGLGPP